MTGHRLCLASLALALLAAPVPAQEPVLPPGDKEPLFRLDGGGPMGYVAGLAFSPDGRTLYAAGWDKVVRVWRLEGKPPRFVLDEQTAYRVPIGPDVEGSLNALAVSPDGTWLAVGGNGVIRGSAGFRRRGQVVPRPGMDATRAQDQGLIYVFNTRPERPGVRILAENLGPVVSLAFAPAREGKPAQLLSAAQEWDATAARYGGAVRLWDVESGEVVARLRGLSDPLEPPRRPGLAAWHTGGGPKQLGVAVAWQDRLLRFWDVSAGTTVVEREDGQKNQTALYLDARSHVVTGSYIRTGGRLLAWDPRNQRAGGELSLFDPESKAHHVPRAMAAFTARPGGSPDHLAVISEPPEAGGHYTLQVVNYDANTGRPSLLGGTQLWEVGADKRTPVVAAAPGGRHLAVAGNDDHEIWLFAIADVLANPKGVSPQRLRGAGQSFRSVAFVRKGNDLGLRLNASAKDGPGSLPRPAADDLLFDFSGRSLKKDTAGWQADAPALDGWRVEARDEPVAGGRKRTVLTVRQGERVYPPVRLSPDQAILDYALLPGKVPLLAVAWHEFGDPLLVLYQVTTGEQFRQCSGHSERVRCLAFSADGRLLASVAGDQTVCVWSLTDLDVILGRRARLPGLVVQAAQDRNGVRVVGSRAAELQRDDRIEGLVEDGRLRPLTTASEFYDAIWRKLPGATVDLRVAGRQQPVRLTVGQGIDVQKPLLSLFVTAADKPEQRQWVGWHPLGPYESSDRRVERYLGWQFNTGDAAAPTRFAHADQYRKDYYREGLLQKLVEQGRLPAMVQAPPPVPTLNVWVHGGGTPDDRGQVLVQHDRPTLKLAVANYPPEKMDDWVEAALWQVDGGKLQPFERAAGQEHAAELGGKVPWRRGVHQVRVVLRTREAEPKEYAAELQLRYQPGPPQASFTKPALDMTVGEPGFPLQAQVRPGAAGEAVRVRLVHRHPEKGVVNEWRFETRGGGAPLQIRERLELLPGENEVTLLAENGNALKDYETFERSQRLLTVTYRKPQAALPPRIVLQVVPLLDGGREGPPLKFAPGQPLVVDVSNVRVKGEVKAAEGAGNLELARWAPGKEEPKDVPDFRPNAETAWPFSVDLQLKPGTGNTYRFEAKTGTSPLQQAEMTVHYRPALPRLQVVAPADGLTLVEDNDPPRVKVEAKLTWPARPQPCRAVVLVNDRPTGEARPLTADSATFTETVEVAPGVSQVRLRLENDWQSGALTDAVQVRYLRPPRVKAVAGPERTEEALVNLEAEVVTASEVAGVDLDVNGQPRTVRIDRSKLQAENTWKVTLHAVPVPEGKSEVRLWVRNRDARSLQPGRWTVVYAPPPKPPAPPDVDITEPDQGYSTSEPELSVGFRIRSAVAVTEIELLQQPDGRPPLRIALNPDRLQAAGDGFVGGRQTIQLLPGSNNLQLTAKNAGGQRFSQVVTVSYTRRPLRLRVARLEPWAPQEGKPVDPDPRQPQRPFAAPVPYGRVWLHGVLEGDRQDEDQLRGVGRVWLYVNDIRQFQAELAPLPRGATQRTFRAPLLLSREQANRVELEVPGLPLESGVRAAVSLDCARPVQEQRLHVLLVSAAEQDEEELRQQALRALQATPQERGRFTRPAFSAGYLYPALTGSFSQRKVYSLLGLVRSRIDELSEQGPANDVVLVYYQGPENVTGRGEVSWSDLHWEDLRGFFADLPGAHVLLLDVTQRAGPDRGWSDDTRTGVLRSAARKAGGADQGLLLSALGDALPRAVWLRDVEANLAARFKRTPEVGFDSHLGEGLKALVVGGSP